MKIIYIVFLLTFFSCSSGSYQKRLELTDIDISKIESVEIKKNLYDTIAVELTNDEIQKFVRTVNDSQNAEMRKAFPKYWVFLKDNKDSVLIYKLLDSYIGDNDLYIKTNSAKYFHQIYENGKKTISTIRI